MKSRTTMILAALALATVASIWFWERELPGTDARRAASRRIFGSSTTSDVVAIEIEHGGSTTRVEQAGDDWNLVSPVADAANRFEVLGLIGTVLAIEATSRIDGAEIRGGDAATGLDTPQVAVTVRTAAATQRLEIGDRPAPGGGLYARLSGSDEIVVIPKSLTDSLDRSIDALRERDLFRAPLRDVWRIAVRHDGDPRYTLERDPDVSAAVRPWRLTEPVQDEADDTRAAALLSALGALKAEQFIDELPRDGANPADPPTWELYIELRDPDAPDGVTSSLVMALGSATGEEDGRRKAWVDDRAATFEVAPERLLNQLAREPESFRSRAALRFATWNVARVEMERSGNRLVVESRTTDDGAGRGWQVVFPEQFPLDEDAFRRALSELARVDVLDLVTESIPPVHGEPARLAVIFEDGGGEPIELEILGHDDAGRVVARRTGRTATLILDPSILDHIDPDSHRAGRLEARDPVSAD